MRSLSREPDLGLQNSHKVFTLWTFIHSTSQLLSFTLNLDQEAEKVRMGLTRKPPTKIEWSMKGA